MARAFHRLAALIVVLGLLPGAAAAVTAPLIADTYTSSVAPTRNFGSRRTLLVQGSNAPAVENTYLLFDLTTLPPGATSSTIVKATLTLGVSRVRTAGAFDLFRVLGSGPGAWTESGLTSATAPALAGTAEITAVTLAAGDKNSFKSLDVTQLVKDWVDGVLPNNGIALVANGSGIAATFDSKESTSTSHYAQLDVTLINSSNSSSITALPPLSVLTGPIIELTGIVPLLNGGTAASTALQALANLGAAARGVNSDITALSGLTTPLSTLQGGTGATSAAAALASLGAAARGANGDITSLSGLTTPLSTLQGGTGAASAAAALASLGAAARGANGDITALSGLTTPLSTLQGGTGAASAAAALASLGAAARGANGDITSLSGLTTPLSAAQGGSGTSNAHNNVIGLSLLSVSVDQNGNLGVALSSKRFKEDIRDMGDVTDGLMKLRPVRFRYKPALDPSGEEQYGLIAEEVAKVYPKLVAYDRDGRPYTVRYQALVPMLLNQVQKQERVIAAQARRLQQQAAQIDALGARLTQVEAAVDAGRIAPAGFVAADSAAAAAP